MTTYRFVASSSAQMDDWSNPAIWAGGVVPNDPSANVVFPEVDYVASGSPFVSFITVSGDYAIASLAITENYLIVSNGTLSISGALDVQKGGEIDMGSKSPSGSSAGTLNVGSCDNAGYDIQGFGAFACSGLLKNETAIYGSGLTVSAGSLDNTGELAAASGDLTVIVTPGGFANLTGSTLTGGAYAAGDNLSTPSTLYMNVGGVVTTDAADITLLAGGDIEFFDAAKSAYVPIEATMHTIAASGVLTLENGTDSWGPMTVNGLLLLMGGLPTFPQLTVDKGGQAAGTGTLSGPITNDGTIVAGLTQAQGAGGGELRIAGPVTGTGTLEIQVARLADPGRTGVPPSYTPTTLELGSATAMNVDFLSGSDVLVLDDPAGYTGALKPTGVGDQIQLDGLSLSSVTSYSYAGDRQGGVLTIDVGGSKLTYNFTGDFNVRSFSLSAGPQTLATDPPSLVVTDDGPAPPARNRFDGGIVSDILISNTHGDVVVGQVSAGQETYTRVSGLGSTWAFHGNGDFLADGGADFLIQNAAGELVVGEVSKGAVTYKDIGGLGPDWRLVGAGDFLGKGHDQVLLFDTNGVLDVDNAVGGVYQYTEIGGLGPQWSIVATGDFLGDGKAQFLIENTSGVVVVGEVQGVLAHYTQIGGLGSQWKFVGRGDFLGDGKDQFLIENSAGAVVAGEIGAGDKVQYTTLAGLGPEWRFVGSGDYLGEGHDQFAIENANGALDIGDYVRGQIRYAQVGGLGPEWSFHG